MLYANQQRPIVMNNYKMKSRSKTIPNCFLMMKKSERIAWLVVCFQLLVIISNRKSWSTTTSSSNVRGTTTTDSNSLFMNGHNQQHYDNQNQKNPSKPFYEQPIIHHPQSSSSSSATGLVSREWHSNGYPSINPNLQKGSCWCGADEYCMCSAALAIDCILTSSSSNNNNSDGEYYFWLVQRQDTNQYATMGGFVEVGESSSETVVREMKEEMNIDITMEHATLFGVYSDPKRDTRRHTASIVYHLEIPDYEPSLKAGDDAKKIVKVHEDDIDGMDFFADHKTILKDFIAQRKGAANLSKDDPIKRNVCSLN